MVRRGKSEKVSVTLPRELVREIRALVPQGEVSSFFTEAVQQYIAYRRQRVALEKGFGAWKSENHPDLMTPEDSIAYVRSIREADRERLARLGDSSGK
jgi:Arc/MetJ-type ribon-helix-helix transcriptional regulator